MVLLIYLFLLATVKSSKPINILLFVYAVFTSMSSVFFNILNVANLILFSKYPSLSPLPVILIPPFILNVLHLS